MRPRSNKHGGDGLLKLPAPVTWRTLQDGHPPLWQPVTGELVLGRVIRAAVCDLMGGLADRDDNAVIARVVRARWVQHRQVGIFDGLSEAGLLAQAMDATIWVLQRRLAELTPFGVRVPFAVGLAGSSRPLVGTVDLLTENADKSFRLSMIQGGVSADPTASMRRCHVAALGVARASGLSVRRVDVVIPLARAGGSWQITPGIIAGVEADIVAETCREHDPRPRPGRRLTPIRRSDALDAVNEPRRVNTEDDLLDDGSWDVTDDLALDALAVEREATDER